MPRATDELREEWGIGMTQAKRHLEKHGYILQENWSWKSPSTVHNLKDMDPQDYRAYTFLIQEWDFGGMIFDTPL